jgi:hypothetical protein
MVNAAVDPVFRNEIKISDTTANPGALGLLAFGMTMIILSLHYAGLFGMGSAVFAMGIFFGGIAQVIAGIMEWKKNNTFGMTAFISYGFFWIVLVFMMLMPALGWTGALDTVSLVSYFALWGLFSLVMFMVSLRLSKALHVFFGLLLLLFLLLVIGNAFGNETILHIAGIEGIICGLSAMYTGLGELMNEVYKEKIVNLG